MQERALSPMQLQRSSFVYATVHSSVVLLSITLCVVLVQPLFPDKLCIVLTYRLRAPVQNRATPASTLVAFLDLRPTLSVQLCSSHPATVSTHKCALCNVQAGPTFFVQLDPVSTLSRDICSNVHLEKYGEIGLLNKDIYPGLKLCLLKVKSKHRKAESLPRG